MLVYLALLQERQKDYNRLNESLMIKVRKYEQVLLAKGKESQEQIYIPSTGISYSMIHIITTL